MTIVGVARTVADFYNGSKLTVGAADAASGHVGLSLLGLARQNRPALT
jgi:hypothetical protein